MSLKGPRLGSMISSALVRAATPMLKSNLAGCIAENAFSMFPCTFAHSHDYNWRLNLKAMLHEGGSAHAEPHVPKAATMQSRQQNGR